MRMRSSFEQKLSEKMCCKTKLCKQKFANILNLTFNALDKVTVCIFSINNI